MESLYRGIMAGIRAMTINIPGTAFHHALKVTIIEKDVSSLRTEPFLQEALNICIP